ncbi:hypothetical protein [Herbaspirillum huttiense]
MKFDNGSENAARAMQEKNGVHMPVGDTPDMPITPAPFVDQDF